MTESIEEVRKNLIYFVKWSLISTTIGTVCGFIGTAFDYGAALAGDLFSRFPFLLYLMPAAGLLIIFFHHFFRQTESRGTNLVLESISANEKISPPALPCIFISSLLSYTVGASVGKTGAALQMGGCVGDYLGEFLKLDERDKKVAVMSGMSGCFGAVFGAPLAAAMFGMEVISIGVTYYAALVPCTFSAFLGAQISRKMGLSCKTYVISEIPPFAVGPALSVIFLGLMAALVSVIFCILLRQGQKISKEYIKNDVRRILFASGVLIFMTVLFGRSYCGGGAGLIASAFDESVPCWAFLLKMLFTAVAISGGFKGGEVMPTLAVGASFGAAYGALLGFAPSLCAACGMLAIFVGVTNCPIATMFLGFELFGFEAMPYFALAVAVSFSLSGYYGLYSSQKFIYSKTKTEFINRKAN